MMRENEIKEEELNKLFLKLEREYLTKEARERLNIVKLAHPEVVEKFRIYLLQMLQYGKPIGRIDEEKLKSILAQISKRSKGEIRFRRK